MSAGAQSVHDYCTGLLKHAIERQDERARLQASEAKRETLESLDELANDPAYLAEWTAETLSRSEGDSVKFLEVAAHDDSNRINAGGVVMRHADTSQDADPSSFLMKLRRGETIDSATSDELLAALIVLESSFANEARLDRNLAYALHRIAFEGQILLSEGASRAGSDPASVQGLRLVQEGVDRVLSGQDIRYYADPTAMDFSGPGNRP